MASESKIRTATIPLASVLIAGLLFSLALFRLGIDIESAEILRYMLIGTVPLAVVLAFALATLQVRSARQTIAAALLLGAAMCIPIESLVYVESAWGLRGSELFGTSHLPTLIALLFGWTVVVSGVGLIGLFALRTGIGIKSLSGRRVDH